MPNVYKENVATTTKSQALQAILSRNFIVITALNFLVMLVYFQLFTTTALFASEQFKVSMSLAGFSSGIMVIGCITGRLLTSSLLKFLSFRQVVIVGSLSYIVLALLNFYLDHILLIIIHRLLVGICVGLIGTIAGVIVAYCIPRQFHGLGVSLFSLSNALALALGPFIGINIVKSLGYIFLDYDVIALSLIILALGIAIQNPEGVKILKRSLLKISTYIDIRVIKFALVPFFVALSYGCISAYLPIFGKEQNLAGVISIFFLVQAFSTIVTRPLSGKLYDKYGANIIMYPTILLTALAMLLLAFTDNAYILIIAAILNGLGFGNFQSAAQSIALHLVRKYRYTQATTTYFLFFDLGIGVGPYIFGFVIASYGFMSMFLMLAIITFLSAVLYYLVHGARHQH